MSRMSYEGDDDVKGFRHWLIASHHGFQCNGFQTFFPIFLVVDQRSQHTQSSRTLNIVIHFKEIFQRVIIGFGY